MNEKFDAADYLDSAEAIAAYLTEALDTNDPTFIRTALDTVARAQTRSQLSDDAGHKTQRLEDIMKGQAQPDFETVRQALDILGVRLVVEPAAAE